MTSAVWIGQRRFLHALNYCMLLPGPEAQHLAIYVGWLLNGVRGGLIAGTLFVLPGLVALLALSAIYVGYRDTTMVTAVFAGLAPAVVAIVAQAARKSSVLRVLAISAGLGLAAALAGPPVQLSGPSAGLPLTWREDLASSPWANGGGEWASWPIRPA